MFHPHIVVSTPLTQLAAVDWWTGRVGGRTGIFPSNYAEVLHHPLPTWSTAPPPVTAATARPAKQESAPKYVPMAYKAVHHPENAPNPTGTKPQQQQQQQPQPTQQDGDEVKKSKYSHLKNTVSARVLPSLLANRYTHCPLQNRWQILLLVAWVLEPVSPYSLSPPVTIRHSCHAQEPQSADRSFAPYSKLH